MSNAKIWTALRERMEAFNVVAAERLRFTGVAFERPRDGEWLEIAHFPSEPQRVFYADGSTRRHTGYMQVSACVRSGRGTQPLAVLADSIAAHFPEGLKMSSEGITVRVTAKPSMLSPIEEDGVVLVPIPVRYESIF